MSKKTKKTEWSKNCPECGSVQYYSTKYSCINADKAKTLCAPCASSGERNGMYNKTHSDDVRKHMSKSRMGESNPFYGKTHNMDTLKIIKEKRKFQTFSEESIKKMSISKLSESNPFYNKKHTDKSLKKMSISKLGESNPMYGNSHTDKSRLKMRLHRINEIESKSGQAMPNYNPSSIPIIEAKADELGITDLQHAENGGEFHIKELGYFVDGYSKEKNIVIEYYEPHHNRQVESDNLRQNEIIKHLGCEFIIIEEQKKEL